MLYFDAVLRNCQFSQWLISDVIPKIRKFWIFEENFYHVLSVKNWPKNETSTFENCFSKNSLVKILFFFWVSFRALKNTVGIRRKFFFFLGFLGIKSEMNQSQLHVTAIVFTSLVETVVRNFWAFMKNFALDQITKRKIKW